LPVDAFREHLAPFFVVAGHCSNDGVDFFLSCSGNIFFFLHAPHEPPAEQYLHCEQLEHAGQGSLPVHLAAFVSA
jgi:hypothetical protein